MRRSRPVRAVAAVGALVILATATAASGHAEITPTRVEPGQRVTLTVESIVERPEGLMNAEIRVVVPRQWKAFGCTAPTTWTCALDAKAHKPHTVAVFRPSLLATPADIRFSIDVQAPAKAIGIYLFRTLQKHNDGYTEPWVYDHEPYPAPQVRVGAGDVVVNPEGSREDPRCFGPSKQPSGYDSHDGSNTDPKCPGYTKPPAPARPAGPAPRLRLGIAR